MEEIIFRLKKRILKSLQYQWKIEEMSKITNLSTRHFQKTFKTIIAMSPMSWLQEKRLEKARELLETDSEQINQIGFKVGMSDHSHFTRNFKKKYGVTPTEYRKQYWKKLKAEREIE